MESIIGLITKHSRGTYNNDFLYTESDLKSLESDIKELLMEVINNTYEPISLDLMDEFIDLCK